MQIPAHRAPLYTIFSALIIVTITVLAIYYGQGGFRFSRQGVQTSIGLLAANSTPTGASVYINGKLTTATNDTLDLAPGEYQIELSKDGFAPWKKTLKVEESLVAQTNALLFPSAPSLTPLTTSGVTVLLPSPDGQKVLFYSGSNLQTKKNGLYVLELSSNTLSFARGNRQISLDSSEIDFKSANYAWSPDGNQILVITPTKSILMETNTLNNPDNLTDVSAKAKQLMADWQSELVLRDQQFLQKFPKEVIKIATQSAKNVYFSPDKKMVMYTATASATLPDNLFTPPPASNTQPQSRQLVAGTVYIYDSEEDKNFAITTLSQETSKLPAKVLALPTPTPTIKVSSPSAQKKQPTPTPTMSLAQLAVQIDHQNNPIGTGSPVWFPDSKHVVLALDNQLAIVEYDGANFTPIYAGPFDTQFFLPWPDGSRLMVSTNFNQVTGTNLYAIELK